jgi:hypothetical protein
MALQTGVQTFVLTSRTNFFVGSTGSGITVTKDFSYEPNQTAIHTIQGCLLAGGNPNSVTAGTMTQCISILQ